MPTLLLSKTEVEQLLNAEALLPLLEQALIHHSLQAGTPAQRCRSVLPHSQNSTVVLFPGLSPDLPVYSVKVHAKHPDTPPAIKGVLHLHDLQTGELLAVMDSTHLTAVRTGLTAAFATHLLARTTADVVAVIGSGTQGAMQLDFLIQFHPTRFHLRSRSSSSSSVSTSDPSKNGHPYHDLSFAAKRWPTPRSSCRPLGHENPFSFRS